MTQEDKKLLLQDICARLPYKPFISSIFSGERLVGTLYAIYPEEDRVIVDNLSKPIFPLNVRCGGFSVYEIKPYLHSMSSMTEEEEKECNSFIIGQRPFDSDFSAYPIEHKLINEYEFDINSYINWLNSHHFDYRGLIKKGLALEAPNGMYDLKKK